MATKNLSESELSLLIEDAHSETSGYFRKSRTRLIEIGPDALIEMGYPALAQAVAEWSKTPELYKVDPAWSIHGQMLRWLRRP